MRSQAEDSVENILLTYLNKNTFSGCAAAVGRLDNDSFVRKYYYQGCTNCDDKSVSVERNTFFDLASLTKPLVTVISLLALKKEGKIKFEDTLAMHISSPLPADKRDITILDLLNHTSGLPAHKAYFQKRKEDNENIKIKDVIEMTLIEELICEPGQMYVYSDLDYILLGYIIEKLSNENLGNYWQRKINKPLGFEKEFFWEGCNERRSREISFAATGICGWSGDVLSGKVNDDNCRALGRLSGHAGLFGTLTGVLALCEEILLNYLGRKENPAYDRKDILYLVQGRKIEHWAYGFDVPTGKKSSSGKLFSARTIGHLGYTGTSFWIDLNNNVIAVVLTNRTIYGDNNKKIKEFRPVLHDALLRAIE